MCFEHESSDATLNISLKPNMCCYLDHQMSRANGLVPVDWSYMVKV